MAYNRFVKQINRHSLLVKSVALGHGCKEIVALEDVYEELNELSLTFQWLMRT
ncbi:MAG: hypothetical protein ACTS8H_00020 [Arsenophonus sp. NC-PE1-MAG3]